MNELKLVEGEYATKEEALIEVTETKTDVKHSVVSVKNILQTISFLEQKKINFCAEVDKEIAINKAMLLEAQPLAETATISINKPLEEI